MCNCGNNNWDWDWDSDNSDSIFNDTRLIGFVPVFSSNRLGGDNDDNNNNCRCCRCFHECCRRCFRR